MNPKKNYSHFQSKKKLQPFSDSCHFPLLAENHRQLHIAAIFFIFPFSTLLKIIKKNKG